MDDKPNNKRRKAVQSERIGDQEKADELFAEAERIDPGETLEVLQEDGTRRDD